MAPSSGSLFASRRLVLVDTCSLIRLYYTEVKPVAGRTVADVDIRTLERLAKEVRGIAKRAEYAWLNLERLAELEQSIFPLTRRQAESVELRRRRDQPLWQVALDSHCVAGRRMNRVLSANDGFALAAAIEFDATLLTDEWPLKWVADGFDYDDGTPIQTLLSVDLLAMMESEGVLLSDDRRRTYRAWRLSGECLHADSDGRYQSLFGESAPGAQG